MTRVRAYTLVELVVSIAIGAVVVLVAMTALRAASHATTICNRLSVENAMMRAGIAGAHDELDFWRAYDDPDAGASGQPLRAMPRPGHGLPFTPFARSWGARAGSGEAAVGWDGDPAAWSPHRPESCFRGNLAEKARSDGRFGCYGLLSATGAVTVGNPVTTYGTARGEHGWYPNQMRDLERALGFYGLCDYAPANAIFAWHDEAGPDTNAGGIPLDCLVAGRGLCLKPNWEDDLDVARGLLALTQFASCIVPNPRAQPAPTIAELDLDARRPFANDFTTTLYPDHRDAMLAMLARTASPTELLPLRPGSWPSLAVSVRRYVKRARFAATCSVRCVNPITGATIELSFSGVGTTLRGARRQRRPDAGWARWDNATRAADRRRVDTGNDPCLDDH